MKKINLKRFNLRVYGILVQEKKILVIEENERGKKLMKFPGGGLEFGESTLDCLKREFLEEINLPIEIKSHFYTTDFFQISDFDNEEQLVSIYYKVRALDLEEIAKCEEKIIKIHWIDLKLIQEDFLSLPVDKKVVKLLREELFLD